MILGSQAYRSDALVEWVTSGNMARSLLDGEWNLMPGMPHPRGLTGCEYLTSFEFNALLNSDLCESERHSSIKFLCPLSCGCSISQYKFIFTPNSSEYENLGENQYTYTNSRTDLRECPSACVLVQPRISGENAMWASFEDADYYYE